MPEYIPESEEVRQERRRRFSLRVAKDDAVAWVDNLNIEQATKWYFAGLLAIVLGAQLGKAVGKLLDLAIKSKEENT